MDLDRMGLNGSDHPWSEKIPHFVKELRCLDRHYSLLHDDYTSLLSNALWIVSQVPITPDLLQEALSKLLRQVPMSGCCLYTCMTINHQGLLYQF